METNEAELRDRLKRDANQVQAQHRRLVPIFEALSCALASGASRDAQTAVFRLEGAVKAHFLLEEEIVFPVICGLYPQYRAELEALVEEHRGLGAGLQTVIDQVLEAQHQLAARSLESFRLVVKDHEYREEALLKALDSVPSERTL